MRGDPSDREPDLDPQGLWQAQEKEYDPMTLADIHAKARTFESRIQLRNAREYVACGVVMALFALMLVVSPNWMMKAGAGLVVAGTAFVAWQLHRRGSIQASPLHGETLVDAYRRQLIRQRDALRTVGWWYLAPMTPGMALLMTGMWFRTPKPGVPAERAHLAVLIVAGAWVLACAGIWRLNQKGAKRLQARIDEL